MVLLVMHGGALAQVYALGGWAPEASRQGWLWAGLAGLYGSFLLGLLFIAIPLLPWIQRARRFALWRRWMLEDLPELLAMIPVIIQSLRALREAWTGMEPGLGASPASAGPRRATPKGRAKTRRRRA